MFDINTLISIKANKKDLDRYETLLARIKNILQPDNYV